jgi:hypothetical protein
LRLSRRSRPSSRASLDLLRLLRRRSRPSSRAGLELLWLSRRSRQSSSAGSSPCDSRMSPDLLRGTGKSIDGDLDIDDEGSE